jgi:hypothetical protein
MTSNRAEAAYWRDRAAKAREMAATIIDPEFKLRMLAVAVHYRAIAREAEGRAFATRDTTF